MDKSKKYNREFIDKFIKDNHGWLIKWLETKNLTKISGLEVEIFMPLSKSFSTQVKILRTQHFVTYFSGSGKKERRQHLETILTGLVFGKELKTGSAYFMSGFVEQAGRLPTKDDEVKIFSIYPSFFRLIKPTYLYENMIESQLAIAFVETK